ncbi:MAG: patatin-like phospholipase family protein [Clostridium sp.]|nr:patatin-like phospholipase family protein [Clostridium sp.]
MNYGLALSGGGTRGAAHVGVLKALAEADMLPDTVAGASAGSVAAGLYAAGLTIEEMESAVAHLSKRGAEYLDPDYGSILEFVPQLLAGRTVSLSGFLKGNRLLEFFCRLTRRKQLDEAEVKLVIPAVDLHSGDTICYTNIEHVEAAGHVRWEWEAYLCEVMMASSSVPAVFAPRRMGNYLLVDGGVTDNLPGNLLTAAGVERVIAVDVGSSYKGPDDDSVTEVISHSFSIMSSRLKECGSRGESLLLSPPLSSKAGLLTFDCMEDCMERGYRYTKEMLPRIAEALS